VIRRSDGRWAGRLKMPDGTTRWFYRKSQGAVEAALKDALDQLGTGVPLPNAKLTMGAWLREWMDSLQVTGPKRKGLKASTVDYYRRYCEKHLLGDKELSQKPLAKVEAADLARLYRRMTADKAEGGLGLSSTSAHHLHAIVHRALAAPIEGQIMANVEEINAAWREHCQHDFALHTRAGLIDVSVESPQLSWALPVALGIATMPISDAYRMAGMDQPEGAIWLHVPIPGTAEDAVRGPGRQWTLATDGRFERVPRGQPPPPLPPDVAAAVQQLSDVRRASAAMYARFGADPPAPPDPGVPGPSTRDPRPPTIPTAPGTARKAPAATGSRAHAVSRRALCVMSMWNSMSRTRARRAKVASEGSCSLASRRAMWG